MYIIKTNKGFIKEDTENKIRFVGDITTASTFNSITEFIVTYRLYKMYFKECDDFIAINTSNIESVNIDLNRSYKSSKCIYVNTSHFTKLQCRDFIGTSYFLKTDDEGQYIQCQKRDITTDWISDTEHNVWLNRYDSGKYWCSIWRRLPARIFLLKDNIYLNLWLDNTIKSSDTIYIRSKE